MDSELKFLGKYQIYNQGLQKCIALEPQKKKLVVDCLPEEVGANQRINFYGTMDQFVMQAMNGKYIRYEEEKGYIAEQGGKQNATVFSYSSDQYITHTSSSGELIYWNIVDNELQPFHTNNEVDISTIARLQLNKLAKGLNEIRQYGAIVNDLTWVDLSGEDLKRCCFNNAILDYAILSNCNLAMCSFTGKSTFAYNADFSSSNLQYAVMNEGDFTKADFSKADLSNVSAVNANFTEARLESSILRNFKGMQSDFEKAFLNKANCQYGQFQQANFKGADLSSSNFERATIVQSCFEDTIFDNAKITYTVFATCCINANTVFKSTDAKYSNFSGLDLSNVCMSHADLEGCIFDDATMLNTDLSYAKLDNASFRAKSKDAVILSGATLAAASLKGANFTNAQLGAVESEEKTLAANLTGAYMPNAVFDNANLFGVNMSGVSWYSLGNDEVSNNKDIKVASAKNANLQGVNFASANLTGMDFSSANLNGCCFEYADLLLTDFQGASLISMSGKSVSFSYANIQGANFFGSKISDAVFTNAAVSINEGPYFTMAYDVDLLTVLNQEGNVPEQIRKEFESAGYPLEKNVNLEMVYKDCSWEIKNSGNKQYPKYSLYLAKDIDEGNNIIDIVRVGGTDVGVSLFKIEDVSHEDLQGLNEEKLPEVIKTGFMQNGYTLVNDAAASPVRADRKWYIDNNTHDASKIQTGYVKFVLLNTGADENGKYTLYAYGYQLATLKVDADNMYSQELNFMVTTKWIQQLLNDNTLCPNGQRVSRLTDSKPTVRISWEEAMQADILPQTPSYIPDLDPFYW